MSKLRVKPGAAAALGLGGLVVAGWAFYVFTVANRMDVPWRTVATAEWQKYGWPGSALLLALVALGVQVLA